MRDGMYGLARLVFAAAPVSMPTRCGCVQRPLCVQPRHDQEREWAREAEAERRKDDERRREIDVKYEAKLREWERFERYAGQRCLFSTILLPTWCWQHVAVPARAAWLAQVLPSRGMVALCSTLFCTHEVRGQHVERPWRCMRTRLNSMCCTRRWFMGIPCT